MIISIKELIDFLKSEYPNIPFKELMEDYHLRYTKNSLSCPINEITLNGPNKAIELSFNEDKISEGME